MKRNSESLKFERQYAKETKRRCRARGSHDDAVLLVSHFIEGGGKTEETKEQVLESLGWQRRLSNGLRELDWGRLDRAVNHTKDGRTHDDRPCTGFSLHYRSSAKGSQWMLIDPSGDFQHHLDVLLEQVRGDMQQQVAGRTVNGRRIASAHDAADMCLKADPPDHEGYRLMTTYAMELDRFGAVSNDTVAHINAWLSSKHLGSKP